MLTPLLIVKYIINQKTNSIISLFGGKTKEDQLKRYLFSDLHKIFVKIVLPFILLIC